MITMANASDFSKGLLKSEELYKVCPYTFISTFFYSSLLHFSDTFLCKMLQYILETSVYPREPEVLKELRNITHNHPQAGMATAPDAGQLMGMLLNLVNARKTIEVGVFTGYSLLLTALTLPEDGKVCLIIFSVVPLLYRFCN